jgi:rhodanese-related sulfurtransferase
MEVRRILPKEVKEKIDRGESLFILDVRGHSDEYKIKGAIVISPAKVEDQADRIPKDKTIITYCT